MLIDVLPGFVSINAIDSAIAPGGTTDLVAAINTAIAGIAAPSTGLTLYFPPGTYRCYGAGTTGIVCQKNISIWAWGAVFDFGGKPLTAPAFSYGTDAVSTGRTYVGGIQVIRTLVQDENHVVLKEDLKWTGFEWIGLARCVVEGCEAFAFEIGHLARGGNAGGGVGNGWNQYRNLMTRFCVTGLQLEAYSPGWCNDNTFIGGSHVITVSTTPITIPHLLSNIGLTCCKVLNSTPVGVTPRNTPNNNRFLCLALEGPQERKIVCQGDDCSWIHCRYERPAGSPYTSSDILFQPIQVAAGPPPSFDGGNRNVVAYGDHIAAAGVRTDSGAEANQKVTSTLTDYNAGLVGSANRWSQTPSTELAVSNSLTVNETGSSASFKVLGSGGTTLVSANGSGNKVGIGSATPQVRAQVTGPHVVGLGTLAVINALPGIPDNAYIACDHGAGFNGGLFIKQEGVRKLLVDHVATNDYFRVFQYDAAGASGGELIIAAGPSGGAFGGRLGFPHGTTPAKPADLPAAEIDLYDGRIAQMGWHLKESATDVATDKEVIVGITSVPFGGRVVTLSTADLKVGRIIIVKDESGQVGPSRVIQVAAEGGASIIEGHTYISIVSPYGYVQLYSNGSAWFVIGSAGT